MRQFSKRSLSNLLWVRPELVLVASRALLYTPHGIDWAVIEGRRGIERQKELYDQGFSRTMQSRHLPDSDGFSCAVDVMGTGDLDGSGAVDHKDRALTWDRKIYAEIAIGFQRASGELGIPVRWGGTFRGFFDGPHFELVGP